MRGQKENKNKQVQSATIYHWEKRGEKGSKTKINKSTFGPCEETKKMNEKIYKSYREKYINRNARSKGKLLFLKQHKKSPIWSQMISWVFVSKVYNLYISPHANKKKNRFIMYSRWIVEEMIGLRISVDSQNLLR
jgi:hypothetical protein